MFAPRAVSHQQQGTRCPSPTLLRHFRPPDGGCHAPAPPQHQALSTENKTNISVPYLHAASTFCMIESRVALLKSFTPPAESRLTRGARTSTARDIVSRVGLRGRKSRVIGRLRHFGALPCWTDYLAGIRKHTWLVPARLSQGKEEDGVVFVRGWFFLSSCVLD